MIWCSPLPLTLLDWLDLPGGFGFNLQLKGNPPVPNFSVSRSTLEFGMPLLESPLDWLSSWNYDYLLIWFVKMFYSRSALQCNSVRTIPGGNKYHSLNTSEGTYSYRQGIHWTRVRDLIKKHIDTTLDNNPLLPLFRKFDKIGRAKRPTWGEMRLKPGTFNITDVGQFGYGFQLDMFKYFNICGSLFEAQARWWRSGICRYLKSGKVLKALSMIDDRCQR